MGEGQERFDIPREVRVDAWREILQVELAQSWDDVRQNDAILWQIPASIGAIVGLILNAVGKSVVHGPASMLDVTALLAAILVTFSLVVTEYKNRVFQVTRNIYRASIFRELLRLAALQPEETTAARLQVDDYKGLPGFVETATAHIPNDAMRVAYVAAGFYPIARLIMSRPGAYKTLFSISLVILLGEIAMLLRVLVRLITGH